MMGDLENAITLWIKGLANTIKRVPGVECVEAVSRDLDSYAHLVFKIHERDNHN